MFYLINLLFSVENREVAKVKPVELPNPIVEVEKLNALKINPMSILLLGKAGLTYERAKIWNQHSLEFNIRWAIQMDC